MAEFVAITYPVRLLSRTRSDLSVRDCIFKDNAARHCNCYYLHFSVYANTLIFNLLRASWSWWNIPVCMLDLQLKNYVQPLVDNSPSNPCCQRWEWWCCCCCCLCWKLFILITITRNWRYGDFVIWIKTRLLFNSKYRFGRDWFVDGFCGGDSTAICVPCHYDYLTLSLVAQSYTQRRCTGRRHQVHLLPGCGQRWTRWRR